MISQKEASMNIVITGASRGIGLEITKIALKAGHNVLALARHPEESELAHLQKEFKTLTFEEIDLNDPQAHLKVSGLVKYSCIDLLINNAGIYEQDDSIENFQKSYLINAIQPLFLTRALLTKLKNSSNPKAAYISSMMGSIADNTSGGSYSYRSSKTALNMLIKSLSVDEPWLTCLLLHPGWVKTRMGGENAPVMPEDSARGLFEVMINSSLEDTASFQDFLGSSLPW